MAVLSFDLAGAPALASEIRQAIRNGEDLNPLWDTINAEFAAIQRRQFAEGGPPGRPWKPNSRSWQAYKGGKPVGEYTGRLRRSLSTPRGRGRIVRKRGRVLLMSTRVPYAGAFNAERPLFSLVTPDVQERWTLLLAEHVVSTGGRGGSRRGRSRFRRGRPGRGPTLTGRLQARIRARIRPTRGGGGFSLPSLPSLPDIPGT